MRVLICGGPKVGKTFLADRLGKASGHRVRHTDDLIGKLDWSQSSEEVSKWMDEPGPWIIEGVSVPRAIRKFFDRHHRDEKPCDIVYWGQNPRVPRLLPGQVSMAKGVLTVWSQVNRLLLQRGVRVESFPEDE